MVVVHLHHHSASPQLVLSNSLETPNVLTSRTRQDPELSTKDMCQSVSTCTINHLQNIN
ncbi:hypothetical protein DPMN_062997 [Dreissena polymorpha]|uniref:Uncharacterized protein n=1 Tax=Dreissena polymorpha TaxID=45954 RepID=A0A9D4CAV8_DREPO|nr:hypothetical protein DPMN_062997 [Dreissena polymorpha]